MAGQQRLWRERSRMLEGETARVRPEIAESWRRSALSGVPADRWVDIPQCEQRGDTALARAAAPVVNRLVGQLDGTATSVILSDGRGQILERHAGERGLARTLDAVGSVPGALLAEEVVGTNGIGTVLERRLPTLVSGAEHYAGMFGGFSCAGAPIFDPFSGRLAGVIDVSCRFCDTNPRMLPLVMAAAAAISDELLAASSLDERLLLDHHLRAVRRRGRRPTVTVGGELVLANATALRLLRAEDHEVLRDLAAGEPASVTEEVTLSAGRFSARLSPIEHDGHRLGLRVELDVATTADRPDSAAGSSGSSAAAVLGPLVGGSPAWLALAAAVRDLADQRVGPLLVVGEPGTGKASVARVLLVRRCGDEPSVLDAAGVVVHGAAEWLQAFERAARRAAPLVVRHVDLLDAPAAVALASLIDGAGHPDRLAFTASPGWTVAGPRALVDRLAVRLAVPTLAERRGDVARLLAAFSAQQGAPGLRWLAPTVRCLEDRPMPGNVRQVESVVTAVVTRQRVGDVDVDRLPAEYRRRIPAGLSRLARLERDAIEAALAEAGGNRHRAAATLGISRATLYRKLGAYQLGG